MFYSILMSIVIIPMFISLFFLIGKITQRRIKIFENNEYMSIPLGFIFFSSITLITFTPLIIFRLPGVLFIVFEALKDFGIFILIWLNRKYIKMSFDYKKILLVLGLTLLVVFLPTLITYVKSGSGYPYKLNYEIYLKQYRAAGEFEPWKEGNIYNSWYAFNSAIIKMFDMNGDFEVWWIQSFLIGSVLSTTVLALLKMSIKKIRFVAVFVTVIIVAAILFLTVNNDGLNYNSIGIYAVVIILLITSRETLSAPRVRYFIVLGLIGFTLLTFDWSALWLYSAYMIIFVMIYIYKEKPKPTLLIIFTIVFIGFILATSIHRFSTIGSTIGIAGASIIGFLFVWLRKRNIEIALDKVLYRFKAWLFPVAFLIFVAASLTIWLTKDHIDPWISFGIKKEYLNTFESLTFAKVLYGFYWLALLMGIVFSVTMIKNNKRMETEHFLILVGTLSTLMFFSPLTAPFVKTSLIPVSIFENLKLISIFPLVIGLIIKIVRLIINKIKGEHSEIDRSVNV